MRNIPRSRERAARYARALLDVALAESTDPHQVERALAGFGALFDEHAALRRVLWSPTVPAARKQAVIGELAARAGYPAPLARLLQMMAERDHLALLPELVTAFRRRLQDHLGVVEAEITAARPLGADRQDAIGQALARLTGKRVSITTRVDPSLIGGVVARVGSTVYDGTVVRQLERIREKIAGEG